MSQTVKHLTTAELEAGLDHIRRAPAGEGTLLLIVRRPGVDERQVIEETRDLLQVFADTPRFVLNAGCAIPRSTPSANIHAMIRTAREFR